MANEGEFPKTDGDILYASETNRFAGACRTLGIGAFAGPGSGTATQVVGSILVGAGSVSNPCELKVSFYGNKAAQARWSVQLSGTGQSTSINDPGAGSKVSGVTKGDYNSIVGSPFNGHSSIFVTTVNNADEPILRRTGYLAVNNFDVSSDFVIFFNVRNQNAAGGSIHSYSIQAFRNGT